MHLRRVNSSGSFHAEIGIGDRWVRVADAIASLPQGAVSSDDAALWSRDLVALLGAPASIRGAIFERAAVAPISPAAANEAVVLPFEPLSFRDFMLYGEHAIAAARGFARSYFPRLARVASAYEAATGAVFPAFKPKPLWDREPIYYFGNHLTFATDGEPIALPDYARTLDFELELGFVLARPLLNATPREAEAAIGGFFVLNDFGARDRQLAEMRSGFGPQKSKHFATSISSVVVTADAILPRWRELNGAVRINDVLVAQPKSPGARWSLGEAVAHASRSEALRAGEVFATGTWPGGSGIEIGRELRVGDEIALEIADIGSVTNLILNPD